MVKMNSWLFIVSSGFSCFVGFIAYNCLYAIIHFTLLLILDPCGSKFDFFPHKKELDTILLFNFIWWMDFEHKPHWSMQHYIDKLPPLPFFICVQYYHGKEDLIELALLVRNKTEVIKQWGSNK